MTEQPFSSDYYGHPSQDYPYLQGGDNLDDYFFKDFVQQSQYSLAPQAQHSWRNPMHSTRRNTDITEASESVSPYLRSSDFSFQNLDDQHKLHSFAKYQSQSSQGSTFRVTFGTNVSISYNRENITKQYVNYDLSPQEQSSSNMEEGGTGTDGFEEESYEERSQKGGVLQYKSVLNSKIWGEEMDDLLLKLGAQYKCNWKRIAKKYSHKKITPAFLKMRYKELSLSVPITRRIKFTHREDLMLAKYFEKLGSNWAQMAVFFPKRTAIMLKNRYYSFIRKKNVLDILLCRVREVEANDTSVDDLNTPEAKSYTECLDLERKRCQFVVKSLQQKANSQHLIFGYEGIKPAFIEQSPDEKDSEIKILKAQVESLQSLYLKTKAELEKSKNKE